MHDTAFAIGAAVIRQFVPKKRGVIVEIGAMNVNGTLRDAVPHGVKYIGVDQFPGKGVDLIVPYGSPIPIPEQTADLVIASSVLEHDACFWETFRRMCQLAKVGGHVYINVPSNGSVHSYPVDCWRFYPDAGVALERFSESTECPMKLVESFVAERQGDQWNDFVAIFRRGPEKRKPHGRIYKLFDVKNVRDEDSSVELNIEEHPEDVRIVNRLRDELNGRVALADHVSVVGRLEAAEAHVVGLEGTLSQAQATMAQAIAEREARDSRIAELEGALSQAQATMAQAIAEREVRDGRIAELEGALSQTQATTAQAIAEREARDDRIAELEGGLSQAQATIAQATAEREARDTRIGNLNDELAAVRGGWEQAKLDLAAKAATIVELRAFCNTLAHLLGGRRGALSRLTNLFKREEKPILPLPPPPGHE